jgi:hypothetical protein
MIVIVHLTVTMANPVVALADGAEQIQPGLAVLVIQVNVFAAIASGCDMVDSAGKFYS